MSIGVTDSIAPLGTFPVLEDVNLKGGYQTSPSTVDRDAIPAASRKVGMLVYTVATDQTWVLGPGITNSDWTLYQTASALTVKDETVALSTAVTSIDFQGAGVTATGATSVVVTIPGGVSVTASAPANVTKAAAAVGVATDAARADHKHDISTAAPTTGIGAANSEGAASTLARSDHSHALRTTTGPTDLAIGAITDGEFLKRVGTAIVSAALSGGTQTVQEEGATQSTTVTTFNFVGLSVTASGSGATATITVSPLGGTTAARPVAPAQYTPYWDTTLGIPVWYVGSAWVDAAGVSGL